MDNDVLEKYFADIRDEAKKQTKALESIAESLEVKPKSYNNIIYNDYVEAHNNLCTFLVKRINLHQTDKEEFRKLLDATEQAKKKLLE